MLKDPILDAKICEDFAEVWQKKWSDLTPLRTAAPVAAPRPRRARTSASVCRSDRRVTWTLTLSGARSRLDQRRSSRPNTQFSAFFKIYKKSILSQANLQNVCKISKIFAEILTTFWKFQKFLQSFKNFAIFCKNFTEFCKILYILENVEKCYLGCKKSWRFCWNLTKFL